MQEAWKLLAGWGTETEEKTTLINLKRFICSLEGLSTTKILRKRVEFSSKAFKDEFNNFYADDEGVWFLFKKFKFMI